uniref:Uncharacterized protein n=1 Tax=Salix viminalis TaxID=40686 RepID=A0A6N2L1W1_SALVM
MVTRAKFSASCLVLTGKLNLVPSMKAIMKEILFCGPPLRKNCSEEESPSLPKPNDEQEDDGFTDMNFFYVSYGVGYIIVVMGIAAVLHINPFWRRGWFNFIEYCIDTCFYFVLASFLQVLLLYKWMEMRIGALVTRLDI